MKRLAALLVIILGGASLARAESVTVYDEQDGSYHDLSVKKRSDHRFEAFDYETGKEYEVKVRPDKKQIEVYDYRSGEIKDMDVKRKSSGKLEVYDFQDGKTFEVDIRRLEPLGDCKHGRHRGDSFGIEDHEALFQLE